MESFDVRGELLTLLTRFPGRSFVELRACIPREHAGQTKAVLESLVAAQVVTRVIDRCKTPRFSLRP